MDKLLVVLDKKELRLNIEGQALRIDRQGAGMKRIPLGMVDQIVVYGNPQVGCSVWRKLADRKISAVLLPGRGRGAPAWLGAGISTSIKTRIKQYSAWSEEQTKQKVACLLIQQKIKGFLSLLNMLNMTDFRSDKLSRNSRLQYKKNWQKITNQTRSQLKASLKSLSDSRSINSIRGIEGSAAKAWFYCIGSILQDRWKFKNRNRRPPEDPVNALLSLSYVMLMSEIQNKIYLRGLDPCLGFIHTVYPGRQSFVLDILEPLRPCADAFVLSLIKEKIEPRHFSNNRIDGCRLNQTGRRIFYSTWIEWKTDCYKTGFSQTEANPSKCQKKEALSVSDSFNLQSSCRKTLKKVIELWDTC